MYLNLLVYFSLILQTCEEGRVIMTLKYAKNRLKPVIVNGEPAPQGKVPFIVSIKEPLETTRGTFYMNICGGSIISKQKVLTAAHCFEKNKNPSALRVVAGDLRNIVKYTTPNTQWRKIIAVQIHPDFNFPLDDIAVIFVDRDWVFSKFIRDVKIARQSMDYPDSCYVAGYGRIGHGERDKKSEVLLVAKISVLPRYQCTNIWELSMDGFVCSNSVTTDVAIGDSGGPLTCVGTSDPEEEPGKELLAGVTSGKNFDTTSLFTRVSEYKDWIDSIVEPIIKNNVNPCYLYNSNDCTYLLFCLFSILIMH